MKMPVARKIDEQHHFGMPQKRRIGLLFLLAFALVPAILAAPAKNSIDFNAQIRPIISAKCYHCHGPDESSREAKLRLDIRDEATKDRNGTFAIKPGAPKDSELIRRVSSSDPDEVMPPPKTGHGLSDSEKELLKRWIQEGATYAEHWSFVAPKRPALPKTRHKQWAKSPIDHFILAELEKNKLKPSPQADRHALLRRLSLDLTGLPPTPAEIEAFVSDKSKDAYERVVDGLLSSPAFGERWARHWLDLARYADSAGYGSDPLRLNIWPYRDWLIKALNENIPYDQFTIEQLAGDLLENPTDDQRVATAFNRNTMTNTEGGTDDEEWRVAAVKDRVNVTLQTWMGLTAGCAQCHTHKFDPISHTEYYRLYAIFNQTEDNDQPDERPTLPLPDADQRKKMTELDGAIALLEKRLKSGSAELEAELAEWETIHNKSDIWTVVQGQEIRSAEKAEFKTLEDGSILAVSAAASQDTYTLKANISLTNVTAIRLEAIPDPSLPTKGPGRAKDGNFILNDFRVTLHPDTNQPAKARFVRIELPGESRILSLAEVQVFSGTNNLALHGKASQSSTGYEGTAARAIDGNTDGTYERNSTTHTATETSPWWELDLGREQAVDAVAIWNRREVGERLGGARIQFLDSERREIWGSQLNTAPSQNVRFSLYDEQTLPLTNPSATFNQKNREVSKAIDDKTEGASGWGIARRTGIAHHAVFEFQSPARAGTYTFKLTQSAGASQTLGRFRISVTSVPGPVLSRPEYIRKILAQTPAKRSVEDRKELTQWFQPFAKSTGKVSKDLDRLRAERRDLKVLAVPVMVEVPADKQRVTRLLNKGNFLDPGDPVAAGALESFHAWPKNTPTNRLGLAQWIMQRDNPLTARVAVNRFWSQLFGTGLVETEEDFGSQGSLPSHPELLDWMAVEFMEPTRNIDPATATPWNMKRMIKMIVMSATYQQSAKATPELLEKDPRNRLLSRSPRNRLEAEAVRDQALAVAGLLSKKIGGPSVYPPQPDGLWRAAFNGQRTYPTSTGEDRYRRGLYTIWRRTVPYPSMVTFDAPSRESCTFRRLPTNTPLQAYVTLNDPVFVEASQALGRRLVREGGAAPEERIRFGLRLVLGRPERTADVTHLLALFQTEIKHYTNAEKEAVKLATQPIGALPEGLTPAEAAAWTVVANVLLNLDGMLTKS